MTMMMDLIFQRISVSQRISLESILFKTLRHFHALRMAAKKFLSISGTADESTLHSSMDI